jgi:hypothetical protein
VTADREPIRREASPGADLYAFEVTLHRRPEEAVAGGRFADLYGTWQALEPPRESLKPLAVGFDDALERLAELPRMFVEPDGAFVWVSSAADRRWQVDGNLFERQGRVLIVDLKGSCPPAELDRFLTALDWPTEPVMFALQRAGAFLDEAAFRCHAATRGAAGDGQTLRPE